jgi:putative tryptophan/tyrosine transport system substrate-binding protein
MRRRELLLMVAATMGTRAAQAQQKAMPVIGFLHSASSEPADLTVAAFRQGLSETGYVEGQNVAIEYRWAEGHYDRLAAMAADLVDRKVDLIVAAAGVPPVFAAKNATPTIPIVFTSVGDPSRPVWSPISPGQGATSRASVSVRFHAGKAVKDALNPPKEAPRKRSAPRKKPELRK